MTDKKQHMSILISCKIIMFQQWYGSENGKLDAQVYQTGEISNAVVLAKPPQVDCVYGTGQLNQMKLSWSMCMAQMSMGNGELCL